MTLGGRPQKSGQVNRKNERGALFRRNELNKLQVKNEKTPFRFRRTGLSMRVAIVDRNLTRRGSLRSPTAPEPPCGDPNELYELFLVADQSSQAFGQQASVEWLLERFIDARTIKAHHIAIVWQQCNQDDFRKINVLSQVLTNL
jgi:hypothetical protein